MKPGEVLELIHTAPKRYDSVRAALCYRGNGSVQKEIRQRLVRSEVGRRTFNISPEQASAPIRHPEPDGPFGWTCRAWHADDYHWRMETEGPGGGVAIVGGEQGSGKSGKEAMKLAKTVANRA